MPRDGAMEYEHAVGSVGWALELCEGQTTLQRARWGSGAAKLVAQTLGELTAEQRVRAIARMKRGNEIPTPSNLIAWAGSAPRERVPAQEADRSELLPWSDPRAQAAFLDGFNRVRRADGKPEARTATEARAIVMGSEVGGVMDRILAAPDTRTVAQKLADEAFDPFGDEVAA